MTIQGKNLMSGMELASKPRRKQGGSKLAIFAFFFAIIGAAGGGYLLHRSFGDPPTSTEGTTQQQPEDLLAMAGNTTGNGSAQTDVRLQPAATPADRPNPTASATPVTTRTRTPVAATPTPPAQPPAPQPAVSRTPAPAPEPANAMVAKAREDLANADMLIKTKRFDEAKFLLEDYVKQAYPAEYLAAAYYRLGLIGRHIKNERFTQTNWHKAAKEYGQTEWGRKSSLALADTWFTWYAGANPKYKHWEAIRNAYSAAIGTDGARFLPRKTVDRIANNLMFLNEKLIFDKKTKVTGALFHKVQPGENMSGIAQKYSLDTWTSIAQINNIKPKSIRPGMTLKIMTGRLTCLIDRKYLTLNWYLDGKFIKRYNVCIAPGMKTKPGLYTINVMSVEPTWTHPDTGEQIKFGDPRHAIGTRWLAMNGMGTNGLGIHGTNEPESIPGRVSNGCVRLTNKHVEELYGFASIQPGNESEVIVIE